MFYSGDMAELHHKDGDHANWKANNLEVLHRECHLHQANHGRRCESEKQVNPDLAGVKLGA